MEKILEQLRIRASHGDEAADNLYWQAKDLDENAFSIWLADNDAAVRSVLKFKSLMEDPTEDEKKFLADYTKIRNAGLTAYTGTDKVDIYNKKVKTLDDFMGAFGVRPSDDNALTDDDRSAFSNPENSAYWGNYSDEDKLGAAEQLGYGSVEEMEQDLSRAGREYQIRNQVEGWGPNNEFNAVDWGISALKGFAAPRVKDAQLAGREVTWQDVAGDIAEAGLSVVPGVGVVNKAGKVIARMPAAARLATSGAGFIGEQAFVPLASQAMDAGLLYNPDMLGTDVSRTDPRGKFSWGQVGAQATGIAAAKGTVKAAGMMGKNVLEQGMGNETGGRQFKGIVKEMERINEKTDDLIAANQGALDARREAALKRRNVTLNEDLDISGHGYTPDDLINAENYRILSEEANRLNRSQKARSAFNEQAAADKADREAYEAGDAKQIRMLTHERMAPYEQDYLAGRISEDEYGNLYAQARKQVLDEHPELTDTRYYFEGTRELGEQFDPEKLAAASDKYRMMNEAGAQEIVQLPDGRFIYAKRLNTGAYGPAEHEFSNSQLAKRDFDPTQYQVKFDDSQYSWAAPEGTRPVVFKYNNENPRSYPNNSVSRNKAVEEQIRKDPILSRRLDGGLSRAGEYVRDIGGNFAMNAMAREGLAGNSSITDIDQKRQAALWNSTLRKLSPMVTDPKLTPERRSANADAIMNVMHFGLDGLSKEMFDKNPKAYRSIAAQLGVKNWKHPSEIEAAPETSWSMAPTSSSSN